MSRCWLTSLPCPLRVNESVCACVKCSIILHLVVEKKWGGGGGKAEGMRGKESASWSATPTFVMYNIGDLCSDGFSLGVNAGRALMQEKTKWGFMIIPQ